jgi:hypothetical protein
MATPAAFRKVGARRDLQRGANAWGKENQAQG